MPGGMLHLSLSVTTVPQSSAQGLMHLGGNKGPPVLCARASGAPMATHKCPKASPRDSHPPGAAQGLAPAGPQRPSVLRILPCGPRGSASQALHASLSDQPFFLFLWGGVAALEYDLSEPQCSGGSSTPGFPHWMPVTNGVW